jgi:hypothetical protein
VLASAIPKALQHAALAGASDGKGGKGLTMRVFGRVRCGANVRTLIRCHALARVAATSRCGLAAHALSTQTLLTVAAIGLDAKK